MDLEHISNHSEILDPSTPKTLDRSPSPDKPEAAPLAAEDDCPDENSICPECRRVDWDNLGTLTGNRHVETAPWSRTIRTIEANHEQLATSSCRICRILSIVKPQSLDKPDCVLGARSLSDFKAYSIASRGSSCNNITALHVGPRDKLTEWHAADSRCLVALRRDGEDFSSMTISPRSINYDWLKDLSQSCDSSHWSCFRQGDSLGPVSVSGLKVIEAWSRTIVEAPAECSYVALSYVWGKQPDVDLASHLQRPPQLIEDAISVTLAMGYKYLWIDRYCIPQAQNQERHQMINQMGQVYANASLTIIDASGGDAKTGLPGVSVGRLQKCVKIRNTAILELPCGEKELKSSKWATRGWTYQEGYFSTRRLIFTPSQVLFLCNERYFEESVYCLFQQAKPESTYEQHKFKHLIPLFSGVAPQISWNLLLQLQEYSKRELTYHSDSLNAFLGILNSYTQISPTYSLVPQIDHIGWGLFVRKQRDGLRVCLDWYHIAPAARRPEFPTWTWAGWGGPLVMKSEGITLLKRGDDPWPLSHLDWEISWESEGQKAVNIWDAADGLKSTMYTDKLQQHQQPTYLKQLQVTCLVVPIHFRKTPLKEAQKNQGADIYFENEVNCIRVEQVDLSKENVAMVPFSKGLYIASPSFLDQELDVKDCVVGLLFARRKDNGGTSFGCLLARELGDCLYERVGAMPHFITYPRDGSGHRVPLFKSRFLDEAGNVLHKVRLTSKQKEMPFDGVGRRRTIVMV